MNTKERLIAFISKVQGTPEPNISQFEKKCGLTNAYVKNIRKSIGEDALKKILVQYPNLNKYWLLHGEGDMEIITEKKDNHMETGKEVPTPVNDVNHAALLSLIDANKMYASCYKDLTAAHAKTVDLNVKLAGMLEAKITGNEMREMLQDDGARLRVFQELLIQIGSGKGWESEKEARAEVHRLVTDALLKV